MASDVHPSTTGCKLSNFIVQRAFLVKETCLDVLFQCLVCFKCHCSPQNVAKYIDGDCLFVTVFCPSGHLLLRWSSRYVEKIEIQNDAPRCKQPTDTDHTGETRNIVQEVTVVSNRDADGRKTSVDEDATVASSSKQARMDQEDEDQEEFAGEIVIKLEKEENPESFSEVFVPSVDQDPVSSGEIVIKLEKEEKPESSSEVFVPSVDQDPVSSGASEMTAGPQHKAGDIPHQTCDPLPQEKPEFIIWSGNSSKVRDVVTPVVTTTGCNGERSHRVRKSRKYLCSFCTKQFSMGYNLRIHELMHRKRNQRRHSYLSCAITGNSFCRQKKFLTWKRHNYSCKLRSEISKRLQHRHTSNGMLGSLNLTTSNSKSDENRSITKHGSTCITCHKEFRSSSSCQKHQERHFPSGKKKLPDVFKKAEERLQWLKKTKDSSNSDVPSIRSKNCRICGTVLTTAFKKRVHECFHSEPKTFQCQLCPRAFAHKSILQVHLNVHMVQKHFACKFCRKQFSSHIILQQHERTHQGLKPFNCNFCDYSFETVMDRNEHEKIGHAGETTIPCKFCHKIFKNVKVHRLHEKKHLICKGSIDSNTDIEMEKGSMEASEYLKVLSNMVVPSQDNNTDCNLYESSNTTLASFVEEPELKTTSCKFCGKQALSTVRLATHECIHRHLKPFKCQDCLKSFVTRSSLTWHTENAHQVKCRVCDEQFLSPSLCQKHEQINHLINECETEKIDLMMTPLDNGLPSDVDVCLEGSRGSTLIDGCKRRPSFKPNGGRLLNREEQSKRTTSISQQGEDPSDISVLPSVSDDTTSVQPPVRAMDRILGVTGDDLSPSQSLRYEDRSEDGTIKLVEEMQSSTSTGDPSSYCCRYCGKQLSSRTTRKYHERIHTGLKPNKCRFCPKAFTDRSMLNAHERIHTGEKPYSCSYCDKKFFQSSHKRSHERVHTGEKPYKCSFCRDRFTTSSGRNKHEERVHSMEKRYKCEFCSQIFSLSKVYNAHLRKHREEWARLAANGQTPYQSGDQEEAAAAEKEKEEEEKNEIVESADVEIVDQEEHEKEESVTKNETLLQTNRPIRKKYPCHYCDRVLYAEGNRKVHERKHMSDWSIKCRFCNEMFPNAELYKIHEVTHTGETPYRCRYCDECFDQSLTRTNHEYIHTTDMAFSCRYCDMKFMSKPGCDDHEQLHFEKPYKCKFCDQAFSFMSALDDHKITCGLFKPHSCNPCGMQFATLKFYKAHLATHAAHRTFVCTKCGKTFKTATDVKKHELIHTEGTPYQCQFCDKAFKTFVGVKKHEQTHSESRAFQCRYCEKCFKTKPSRDVHERCHTGEKPYPCSYCDTRFGSISARRTHHLLHTGEVPHKCQYCSRPFRHSSSLKRHIRLHTGEKPYECKLCGDRFRDIKQCRNHEYKHTGERPYMCSYCGKSFRDKRQLVKHERIHTGEKPYKCTYCEEMFSFYTSRKNHMERFHGEMMSKVCEDDAKLQGNEAEETLN